MVTRVQSGRSQDSDVHGGGVDVRYPRGANKALEIEHGSRRDGRSETVSEHAMDNAFVQVHR
jgi:hypothetical protein